MFYITVKQSPKYRQLSLEEFLFGAGDFNPVINYNETNTRTYEVESVSQRMKKKFNFDALDAMQKLINFNQKTKCLREVPRSSLYHSFKIPKRSGGSRRIDAPNDDLKLALYELKEIFEKDFYASYHTSAFAYIKGRSTISCVKKHQDNTSRWFAKLDLSNFFGSTTLDFVMNQLSMIYPFCEVCEYRQGRDLLREALDLAFLNGGLPQGTPISPLITNIMMIPIDHTLSRELREFVRPKQHKDGEVDEFWEYNFVYTRYADDFIISSRYDFDIKEVENCINGVLEKFKAPFLIKPEKTRYGSSAGRNWNLGVMLNKDNQITIGHKKKHQFEQTLTAYVLDHKSGILWDLQEVQAMEGLRSYYRMVEGEAIDRIVAFIGDKFGVNIPELIKNDLKVL